MRRLELDCSAEGQPTYGPRTELVECFVRLDDRELDACKDALVAFRHGLRTRSCDEYSRYRWKPPWECLGPTPGESCIGIAQGPYALLPGELPACRNVFGAAYSVRAGLGCPLE